MIADLSTGGRHARQTRPTVTSASFAQAAELAADLEDAELTRAAWS